jgi:hypothetical protein
MKVANIPPEMAHRLFIELAHDPAGHQPPYQPSRSFKTTITDIEGLNRLFAFEQLNKYGEKRCVRCPFLPYSVMGYVIATRTLALLVSWGANLRSGGCAGAAGFKRSTYFLVQ